MKCGQQKRIPAFTSPNHSYHLISAYLWAKDQVFTQAGERKNSQTFIQFLDYLLLEQFPTQKIILVLDNASYHKSRATLAALSLFESRVKVFWLPKYCPNQNPIERFWRHLKDLACANKLDLAIDNLANRVDEILSFQNSKEHPLENVFFRKLCLIYFILNKEKSRLEYPSGQERALISFFMPSSWFSQTLANGIKCSLCSISKMKLI